MRQMRRMGHKLFKVLSTSGRVLHHIPGTVKAIGCTSFLLNMSTLMIYSLFAVYLQNVLHVDLSKISFLDGAVDATSFLMKLFSGFISDVLQNRKIVFLTGTILLFIAKPLEAIGIRFWPLFCAKILERLGNGMQATPRDALVGDWAPKVIKDSCFGMRQSCAALGSVAGAVAASFLFYKFRNFQTVFWFACIPSALAVLVVSVFVKNKSDLGQVHKCKQIIYRKIRLSDLKSLDHNFWTFLSVVATYNIAKVGESILILYVTIHWNLPFYLAPVFFAICHIANCLASWPAGIISDRIKQRENIFLFGLVIFIVFNILLIKGQYNLPMTIGALFCFGIYLSISQSIFPAKIIEIVPAELRGTGLGIYNFVCAISLLCGGTLLGFIAQVYEIRAAFYVSIALACFGILLVLLLKIRNYCES